MVLKGSRVLLHLIHLLVDVAIGEAAQVRRYRVRHMPGGDQRLVGTQRLRLLLRHFRLHLLHQVLIALHIEELAVLFLRRLKHVLLGSVLFRELSGVKLVDCFHAFRGLEQLPLDAILRAAFVRGEELLFELVLISA